jgi:tRNA-dihydrouridine synthase 1
MPPSSPTDLLAYTPMLHARLFSETVKFRENHFNPLRSPLVSQPDSSAPPPTSTLFLDGNPAMDRPLITQFCANDPEELLKAAKYVAPFCDAVDLNLGCPQGIARKGTYGAFLQEDQDRIYSLIHKLHIELEIPVTAKIRILETKEKTLAYAQNVLKAGASILTVHGRHREQKGHKTGLADWSVIRYLREQLPKETVLFANGNILRRSDIDRCLEETGADGVMSAEGNLYDPSIFSEAPKVGEEGREYWRGRDGKGGWRMDATLRRYMDIIYEYVLEVPLPNRKPLYLPTDPDEEISVSLVEKDTREEGPPKKRRKRGNEKKEKVTSPNLLAMQPHLFKLLRPLVAKHHNVRDALAKCKAGDIAAFESVLRMVEVAVKEGLKRYHETEGRSWEEESANDERLKVLKKVEPVAPLPESIEELTTGNELYESSVEMVKACRRPWWVVQPYVRPLPIEALAKGSLTLGRKDLARLAKEEAAKSKDSALSSRHTEVEKLGNGDTVEVPEEGLVCG